MKRVVPSHVTLSESQGVRALHFGTEWIQGAMRLSRPFALELEYTRQMMAWLLFLDPSIDGFRIAQLGLGAASLTKFCLRHCAAAEVVAVEIDAEVIACAHAMFALPVDHPRLTLVHDAAGAFVGRRRSARCFDVIQIDLYDAQARGPVEDSVAFYSACRAALAPVGIVVVNLFGAQTSSGRNYGRLLDVFEGRVVALPEIDAGNRVALAFQGPPIDIALADLYSRALQIEAVLGLRARKWATALQREVSAQRGRPKPGRFYF